MADQHTILSHPGSRHGASRGGELLWLSGELLASASLEIDTAMLAVATACRGCDADAVLARLDRAALELFDCDRADCQAQAGALARLLTDTLGLLPEETDPRGLLIDHALTARAAHPLVIAAIGRELARRAGLHSHVCQTREGWWTALCAESRIALVGNHPDGPPCDPRSLHSICPHRLAHVLLRSLARCQCPWAGAAERLLGALPDCATTAE